jgi:transposase
VSARSVLPLDRARRRRLERWRRKTGEAGLARRITIVLLYAQGHGTSSIATLLGCAPATAVRVLQRFRARGERALEDGRRENGAVKADADLLQALAECVRATPARWGWRRPTWTLEMLTEALERATGVRVSRSTLHRMLVALGVRWGSARPAVSCPWSTRRRRARLRRIQAAIEGRGPDEVAYYVDEVDIHLNPRIGRDWMMPGEQTVVMTPGKNAKGYIAGALSVDGTDFVHAQWPKKNGDLFIALLGVLHRHHREARRIHLIVDNFVIHSCASVARLLARLGDRFRLHFLPPYCPNENKIERLWRDLHANVTRNHRCSSLEELLDEVRHFLGSEANRRRALANPRLHRTLPRAA